MKKEAEKPDKPKKEQQKAGEVSELESIEGLIEVTRTVLDQTKTTKEKIKIRPFVAQPAHVSVKMGHTMNLGDYNTARVDIMVTVPCYKEELVPVYQQVKKLVDGLMDEVIEEIKNGGE